MTDTAIAADRVAAYRATQYRIGGSESFTLSIDKQSDALLQLYRKTGQDCGLFITAFNPFGQAQSAEANEAAHSRLGEHLRALSRHVIEGAGYPSGDWTPELSYFALGISEGAARQLGRRFDQDAVVWAGADAVPRLLLLR
jgi:sugar phosphate isomerase/epimerase